MHGISDPLAGLEELRRVLRPGGKLALREDLYRAHWLPFDLGIGTPGLEYRLDALYAQDYANYLLTADGIRRYPLGWLGMLQSAGFGQVVAKTFLMELAAPFSAEQVAYLYSHLQTPLLSSTLGDKLSSEDHYTLRAITDPDSPHYIFNRNDLYAQLRATVYLGMVL